jgi:hypothetical protein
MLVPAMADSYAGGFSEGIGTPLCIFENRRASVNLCPVKSVRVQRTVVEGGSTIMVNMRRGGVI